MPASSVCHRPSRSKRFSRLNVRFPSSFMRHHAQGSFAPSPLQELPRYYEPMRGSHDLPSLGFMRPCGVGLCLSASHGTFPALTHQPSQGATPHTPAGQQGALVHDYPCCIGLRRSKTGSAPTLPQNAIYLGFHFGAADIRLSCGPLVCSPFVSLPPACASGKGFVTRACHRFVASPVVGSAIRPNWTIAGVGLSPTG